MKKTLNYKIVDLVESYNFHLKFTSIQVHAKKSYNFLNVNLKLRSEYENWDLNSISIIWLWRWLQMEITLNYKIVDPVESYNFSYKVYLHPS
jgi:hypothetical protein